MTALEFFLSQHTRLHSAKVGQVEGGSFADLAHNAMHLGEAISVRGLPGLGLGL